MPKLITSVKRIPPDQRDAFLDALDEELRASGRIAVQTAPGVYLLSSGESYRVDLPVVNGKLGKAGAKADPRADLPAPLAAPGEWTFDRPVTGSVTGARAVYTATHQTWFGARALAAVALQREPGELRLVSSPI